MPRTRLGEALARDRADERRARPAGRERVPRGRRQPAPADPVRRPRAGRRRARRGARRRDPRPLCVAPRRLDHRRARRRASRSASTCPDVRAGRPRPDAPPAAMRSTRPSWRTAARCSCRSPRPATAVPLRREPPREAKKSRPPSARRGRAAIAVLPARRRHQARALRAARPTSSRSSLGACPRNRRVRPGRADLHRAAPARRWRSSTRRSPRTASTCRSTRPWLAPARRSAARWRPGSRARAATATAASVTSSSASASSMAPASSSRGGGKVVKNAAGFDLPKLLRRQPRPPRRDRRALDQGASRCRRRGRRCASRRTASTRRSRRCAACGERARHRGARPRAGRDGVPCASAVRRDGLERRLDRRRAGARPRRGCAVSDPREADRWRRCA